MSDAVGEPAPAASAAETLDLSFEDALAELERIVRDLEGGKQRLDEAIAAFERGTVLRRYCEAKLAEAERRVAAIVEESDGGLSLRPIG